MKNFSSSKSNYSFNPQSQEPFRLSRSKIDLFIECQRCFYLDRRLGIARPAFPPFTLNNAVDVLLKKEFDIHRAKNKAHALMRKYKIKAVPFDHPKMNEWRHNFTGIQYLHPATNFLVFGAIDDVWIDKKKMLYIVDYKSTGSSQEISLEDKWKQAYKRQMEIYQWLFRHNDFKVSDTGYFVFAVGQKDREAFDAKLEFEVKIIPYQGNDSWIEQTLIDAHQCLMDEELPSPSEECPYCNYRQQAQKVE